MAIPTYNPTEWVNYNTPAINETNLNKLEAGLRTVTDEAIRIVENPIVASEVTLGVVKMWTTNVGGVITGHFSTT